MSDSVKVERWAVLAFAVAVVCVLRGGWWRLWPQTTTYDMGPGALAVTSRQLSSSLSWDRVRAVHLQGQPMSWGTVIPRRGPVPLRLLVVTTDGGAYTAFPRILLWGRQEYDEARHLVEEACERESVTVEYLR